ncbi:MAG TPA: hypothetical protein VHE33_04970 [Acidobacteriaceae bacterium]|nr:hypothetical protein [Acidobacteriaceae bacterium]
MAQPLTMLRASIEVLAMPLSAGIDRQKYLEVSAGAVERTCHLFARVQDLVAASMIEAEKAPFDLWSIVANVVEEQRNRLLASGATIAATKTENSMPILGDAARTEQAIVLVLRLAGELANAGDVIELSGSSSRGFLELCIENSRQRGKPVDSTARLNLALAEANIASQRGRYEFVEDPFRVSLALPLADRGQPEIETDLNRCAPQSMH